MDKFEYAVRKKLRFGTARGPISAEDLWDLPLTSTSGRPNLNEIAVGLHTALQRQTVSFVEPVGAASTELQAAFDVVKHVIDTKKAEAVAAKARAEKSERRQKIADIIAKKQDEALTGLPLEELQKLLREDEAAEAVAA